MHETAITVDHETGRVRVDTTLKRYKGQLQRAGFKGLVEDLGPYSSWEGTQEQIPPTLFRKGKSARRKGTSASDLAKARKVRDISRSRPEMASYVE